MTGRQKQTTKTNARDPDKKGFGRERHHQHKLPHGTPTVRTQPSCDKTNPPLAARALSATLSPARGDRPIPAAVTKKTIYPRAWMSPQCPTRLETPTPMRALSFCSLPPPPTPRPRPAPLRIGPKKVDRESHAASFLLNFFRRMLTKLIWRNVKKTRKSHMKAAGGGRGGIWRGDETRRDELRIEGNTYFHQARGLVRTWGTAQRRERAQKRNNFETPLTKMKRRRMQTLKLSGTQKDAK